MKTADQLTADKLRGGFYSPPGLVKACLDRVHALTSGQAALRILEPSAGDGAFIRGLARHDLSSQVSHVTAVEVNIAEAEKCRQSMRANALPGTVIPKSMLNGARSVLGQYEATVGNPPFLRFQFLAEEDRRGALEVARESGVELGGVSNLWIPIFLSALNRLVSDGAFAFIVPAECFTGISASAVRRWLTRNVTELQVDIFPPGSFPTVLQEIVVISGRRAGRPVAMPGIRVVEHHGGTPSTWTHELDEATTTWTRYLLTPTQLSALSAVSSSKAFHRFSEVARLIVSTVTGANEYFSVDDNTLSRYALETWALPLLARIRYAPGIVFDDSDHKQLAVTGSVRWLLDFSAELPSPEAAKLPSRYLRLGEEQVLNRRYKCRIRAPWYRVPVVNPGRLLLSKRSHRYPRLVLNEAGVVTTDTIYQGHMNARYADHEADLVVGFHNTVTLLTAELEGRSFGGGVLELVPTEIGRLTVPLIPGISSRLPELDQHVRGLGVDSESIVERTDALLVDALPDIAIDELVHLRAARMSLLKRRMDRAG